MLSANRLVTLSVALLAGNGTINVIRWDGYGSADVATAAARSSVRAVTICLDKSEGAALYSLTIGIFESAAFGDRSPVPRKGQIQSSDASISFRHQLQADLTDGAPHQAYRAYGFSHPYRKRSMRLGKLPKLLL
jgi:hypothetical protein